jgi:molecular chaperone DnaJ
METRDFYVLLGVDPAATPEGIRTAYRHLALRYHPDRAGTHSTRFFQDIVDAYRVLSDPERRASYDDGLRHARGTPVPVRRPVVVSVPAPQAEPLVPERVSLRRDFEARDPPVEEVLERILRNFTGLRVPKSEKLDALNLEIRISPELAAFGGLLELAVPVFYPCPECHGDGHDGMYPCVACDESGMIEEEEPVQLRVRPATRDGDTYEVPLRGLGVHNLYLRVQLRVDR